MFFSYQEDNEEGKRSTCLNNFNLVIEPGKSCHHRRNRRGKIHDFRLIPRFYEVNQGEILIDDVPIKQYELSSLRRAIGHVQQDVFIFYGTIRTISCTANLMRPTKKSSKLPNSEYP